MGSMTGAAYLTGAFRDYGVSHVFLVPTILSQTLADLDRRMNIQRFVTHGEKAAAYMADGYARASGRPGICMAQTVGASNLAAGLRDGYLAGSPIIAMTGGPTPATMNRTTYQQIDDLPAFQPVTKWQARVDRVADLPHVTRQAFRAATSGAPGPVHIELAGHFGAEIEEAEADLDALAEPAFGQVPPFRPRPDSESVRRALDRLAKAERPLIVAGGGVRHSGAAAELLQLAERLNIPVATSINAKDVFPALHPLAVGVAGLYSRKTANQALLAADLVFFIGSATASQVTTNWRLPRPGTATIQLNIDPAEIGRHYPDALPLNADAKAGISDLLATLGKGAAPARTEWLARLKTEQEAWMAESAALVNSTQSPIRPERLCRELNAALPENALVVADTGHSGMWTAGYLDLPRNAQFLRAAGSLGWSLPASIGAACGQPERPVVCFTGDGGFWYHVAELETAVRYNVPVVIVVNDNQSLNQEQDIYRRAYGGKLTHNHADLWHFSKLDLAALARAMGAEGYRVTEPDQIGDAVRQAVKSGKPAVVDVLSDIDAMAPRAFVG